MKYVSGFTAAALLLSTSLAHAGPKQAKPSNAQRLQEKAVTDVPRCVRKLGTISVMDGDDPYGWTQFQLAPPQKLLKVLIQRSGCFNLVDRGSGLSAAQRERDIGGGLGLQRGANVGKGQIKAADYVMTPDLISRNSNAGGNAIGGILGGLVGGRAGAAIGGLNFQKKTADVVLTVTDVRSTEQVALAEGSAKKTDIGWGAGGGLFGGSGWGAGGASGYANTEIGQVITLAYLQAYTDIVAQLGGLPDNASAANAQQAVTMTKPGRLFPNSKGTGKIVRTLDAGMMLYPTGNKDGMMWEVEDELGNKGWVSSSLFELAR